MFGVIVLMIIFSICIFLFGLQISTSKDPFLPITYHGRRDKEYLSYLGKCVRLTALCPFLTAITAFTGNIIATGIVFVGSLVACLVIAAKWNKKVEK